jgi:deazaflavin-dependent oxidoreductase (nitroreductase family)
LSDINDFNRNVIEEFRAHGGKVGGAFEQMPLLLLTTTGANSGERRTTPVAYLRDGARLIVFASKAGAPENPAWYHNLRANPSVTVEVGSEEHEMQAVELEGEERDRLFARQSELQPQFAQYAERTPRTIPVVALLKDAAD